jgi:hypothetical protein
MGPILPFIRPYDGFSLATLELLAQAFGKALASIRERPTQPAFVREILANHILDLATMGELDVNVLSEKALAAFGARLEVTAPLGPSSSSTSR